MKNLQLILTDDGSSSLRNISLHETYHSTHGAMNESQHVFIQHGLRFFVEKNKPTHVSIFEVGFGTGLNALLSLIFCDKKNGSLRYTAVEAFPIDWSIAKHLNYSTLINYENASTYFKQIHEAEWEKEISITPNFSLLKNNATLQTLDLLPSQFDII